MSEQTNPKAAFDEMLAKIQLDKEKQLLKQEKVHTQKQEIQVELFEEAERLNEQSQAVANLKETLQILQLARDTDAINDVSIDRGLNLLVKDALKRARASYKAKK